MFSIWDLHSKMSAERMMRQLWHHTSTGFPLVTELQEVDQHPVTELICTVQKGIIMDMNTLLFMVIYAK